MSLTTLLEHGNTPPMYVFIFHVDPLVEFLLSSTRRHSRRVPNTCLSHAEHVATTKFDSITNHDALRLQEIIMCDVNSAQLSLHPFKIAIDETSPRPNR